MSKQLSNPLQALIRKSASTLPATTGTVARYEERLNRTDGPRIILADLSGSMESPAWGQRRKIDLLCEAVDSILGNAREPVRLIAFAGTPVDGISQLPREALSGSTALHLALDCAARHRPRATLVISDGQPDDEEWALAAARNLPGRIDVLYIGPDIEKSAIQFMQRLARLGCGDCVTNDLAQTGQPALERSIRQLLLCSS
ncbi:MULTISPECIES: vWA domain-containing protein [unclassified Brenneria]|uniref:vWA domain-containing protein n=1 Tax=unclassified Brenneria TaxID=2634434 RepID=UPI0018F0B24A|nr:vWA domain-containing protein [Brenneria sp. L3-3C-1]MBJ7223593.1 VWA domain-containing protein [Brenneria sp. L3-3C-1]MEE3644835.1 vWA domain-containing protein [Brenneria sp. L3_3C_1]